MSERKRFSSLLIALLCATGCSSLDNCPDSRDPISITDGMTDSEMLYYSSAPWGRDLAHFPAKTALWFKHGLGVVPLIVQPFLSFSEVGTGNESNGSASLTAGNQSLIDCVDERVIVLRNDTCEPSFYVRLTAMGESQFKDEKVDCCSKGLGIPACSED